MILYTLYYNILYTISYTYILYTIFTYILHAIISTILPTYQTRLETQAYKWCVCISIFVGFRVSGVGLVCGNRI